MSKCVESAKSVTKSMHSNPASEDPQVIQEHYQSLREEMTRVLPEGHPVQLTLLWEHVMRTRQFPPNVDPCLVFHEILARLKNPEWQVRQHALRVLTDILPTLNADVIDENMHSVVTELISNLGHSTPAVRKGSLDALRIYLLHSNDKEFTIKNVVLRELNRREDFDDFHTNVKIGVILSIPLLLFPSKKSDSPPREILQEITLNLADRLVDVMYQKAAVRSLTKIKELVGETEFSSYFSSVNDEIKNNFDILCNAYDLKNKKSYFNKEENKSAYSKNDSTYIIPSSKTETTDETFEKSTKSEGHELTMIPPSRVVLETEIKLDKETAITMTILEEKKSDKDLKESEDGDSKTNDDVSDEKFLQDKRKILRRVHFGGEEVKLRTPESEESEVYVKEIQPSKIPLPLSPATRIPQYRRSLINSDYSFQKLHVRKRSSSASNISKKCEPHVHNANLSPKKSILTNTNLLADMKPPAKSNPKVVHSPKKEPMKFDESNCEPVKMTEEDNVDDEIPAGSFRIFKNKVNDDNRCDEMSCHKNGTDTNDSDDRLMLKMKRNVSPTSFKGFELVMGKENKRMTKIRSRSLDRQTDRIPFKSFEYGKKESQINQDLDSQDRVKQQRNAEKLSEVENFTERENTFILQETMDSNSHHSNEIQNVGLNNLKLNQNNFEILQDNDSTNESDQDSLDRKFGDHANQYENSDFKSSDDSEFAVNDYKHAGKRKTARSAFASIPRNSNDYQYNFF